MDENEWGDFFTDRYKRDNFIIQEFIRNDLCDNITLIDKNSDEITRRLSYMVSPFIIGNMMAGTYVRAWNNDELGFLFDERIIGTTNDFII